MKIRFKKLVPGAVAPAKGHPMDAGYDLTAISVEEDRKRDVVIYGTGLAVEIPKGYVGLIFPRSSVYKVQLSLSNCVGVIDSGYRGEIKAIFRIVQPHIRRYATGKRIAQMVIVPIPDVEYEECTDLSEGDRGADGFGSTGE